MAPVLGLGFPFNYHSWLCGTLQERHPPPRLFPAARLRRDVLRWRGEARGLLVRQLAAMRIRPPHPCRGPRGPRGRFWERLGNRTYGLIGTWSHWGRIKLGRKGDVHFGQIRRTTLIGGGSSFARKSSSIFWRGPLTCEVLRIRLIGS